MSADGPNASWPVPVINYLTQVLPGAMNGRGWLNDGVMGWTFGCEALIALGQARRAPWGAVAVDQPRLPNPLPRWDDIARAVLVLLHQNQDLDYWAADGTPPPWGTPLEGASDPIAEIGAAHGLGAARIYADRILLLEEMGLVTGGTWAARAVPVLWRDQPEIWQMEIREEPLFLAGRDRCIEGLPDDVVEMLHDLAEVTAEEWQAAQDRSIAEHREMISRLGEAGRRRLRMPPLMALRRQIGEDLAQVNAAFIHGWRLEDGWLDPTGAARALPLDNDRLALQMRAAVMAEMGLDFDLEPPE